MIYPTRRAVLLAAAGVPVALLAAAVAPQVWLAGLGWALFVAALMGADALLGPSRRRLEMKVDRPAQLAVGVTSAMDFHARFLGRAPARLEVALEGDSRLGLSPQPLSGRVSNRMSDIRFDLTPERRGEGLLHRLWARWTGPLGLVWKQRAETVDLPLHVGADIQGVKDEAMRLFARDALFGIKAQIDVGEGAEFHALREFQAGMDRRTVDWKQSARHVKLLAKEFRTERNHQVIMALDAGRVMCEPVGGAPRIDRAINAALLMAFVCLKTGDRAGIYAFDDKPRANSGPMAGMGAFPMLQRLAGRIDYSAEETNYTFGLTTLSGTLQRRSLIVIFTDFADPTSAELMIENVGRLMERHLVLFVVMRDEELEGLVGAEPHQAEDVARAVVAGSLLREREVVIGRLRRLGVHIVDAPLDRMGPSLLNAYLDLKRRDLL
ncbi:MAG TPA: DUF58 domain-containing protein [Caulobacteraceae bacterium]|nr:DUF58 domain-containing protein [Caulobacteraceae bacterium]